MSAVAAATTRPALDPRTSPAAVSAPSAAAALLPPPSLSVLGDVSDALTIVCALQAELGAAAVRDAETEAAGKDAQIRAQQAELEAALKRLADAQRNTKGFWADLKKVASTIAKIAGVLAGTAAVALSGGAALPLAVGVAGVALSAGGLAVRELKLLGADSDTIGMWMELGGAGVALGGAALAAVGVTALAAGASGGSSVMQGVRTGATAASAAGTATAAGAGVVIADYQRDADHAAADRQEATYAMERLRFERGLILKAADEGAKATEEALSVTRATIESCSAATDAAIMGVRG